MTRWLVDSRLITVPELDDLPPVRSHCADRRTAASQLPVQELLQPLEEVGAHIRTLHVYSWLGFRCAPMAIWLRTDVISRLLSAQARLPRNFELVVLDGWRSREFQEELLTYYLEASTVSRDYVADPGEPGQAAPHLTGGAVDLTLAWRGAALALGTDYDAFTPLAAPDAFEFHGSGSNSSVRDLRRLLAHVLSTESFVCDPLEWWHWSYGDQSWASRIGADHALYGETWPNS